MIAMDERKTPLTDAMTSVGQDKHTAVVVSSCFARRLERMCAEMAEVLGTVNVLNAEQWRKVSETLGRYNALEARKQ